MLRGLTPARSASASCVRPAARRWRRSSAPNAVVEDSANAGSSRSSATGLVDEQPRAPAAHAALAVLTLILARRAPGVVLACDGRRTCASSGVADCAVRLFDRHGDRARQRMAAWGHCSSAPLAAGSHGAGMVAIRSAGNSASNSADLRGRPLVVGRYCGPAAADVKRRNAWAHRPPPEARSTAIRSTAPGVPASWRLQQRPPASGAEE